MPMKTSIRYIFRLVCVLCLLSSCSHKTVPYISDAQRDTAMTIVQNYVHTILPGDQLYIYVASQTPESVIPFNQETHKIVTRGNTLQYLDTTITAVKSESKLREESQTLSAEISGYQVLEDGCIVFPVLGRLHVAGITQDSLQHYLAERLKAEGYVTDPQVTTRLMNFRVTVVGEVRSPSQIYADGTRLTILEALALCGDLKDEARRDNVLIVRQQDGKQTFHEIDLTHSDFLNSPYYYLQQNDIVYVEPLDIKRRRSDRDENVPKYIQIGVSLWSIVTTELNIINFDRTH